jgi:calcineurin-like phosphoesterase family protein
MARFFTADTHFNHRGILAYCNRPWTTGDEAREGMIERINSIVTPDDDLYILGDFSFGGAKYNELLVPRINGRKHLIKGNHDGFPSRRYLGWGFTSVADGCVGLKLANGTQVLMCHYPYHGDHTDGERYLDRRPVDEGQYLLHGHVHQEWLNNGKQLNVGVDAWDHYPVTESAIIEWTEGL